MREDRYVFSDLLDQLDALYGSGRRRPRAKPLRKAVPHSFISEVRPAGKRPPRPAAQKARRDLAKAYHAARGRLQSMVGRAPVAEVFARERVLETIGGLLRTRGII